MNRINEISYQYAKEKGLDKIPHTKEEEPPGFGIYLGLYQTKPNDTLETAIGNADYKLGTNTKK